MEKVVVPTYIPPTTSPGSPVVAGQTLGKFRPLKMHHLLVNFVILGL